MNSGKPDHLPPASCFLDLNWDGPAEISPQYMNCPPELHQPVRQLAPFSADPAFVERAAWLSCFGSGGGGNYGGLAGQLGTREVGKLLRVSSCKSLRVNMPQLEVGNAAEESSAAVSDPISAGDGESNARKRKAAPKGKSKDTTKVGDGENLSAKRCRSVEDGEIKPKMEQNGGASSSSGHGGKESNVKPPEPQKDYIHVRARRGQATDNHSLAERGRREKISVRMKLLQDLVPGCNKVTGKALMLEEIINYVQLLQQQVEFLSMKLASVNPQLDFNVESILPKDIHMSNGSLTHSGNPMEASEAGFQYTHPPLMTNALESQFLLNTLEPALHRTLSMQLHALEGFGDAASQLESFWENDLQNVVQMGFGQGQEFASHDQLPADHMKIEL